MGQRMLTRRTFTGSVLKMSAALSVPWSSFGIAQERAVHSIQLSGESPIEIPPDFIGLGYEMLSVATPGLLSTKNHRYLELVRGLGPRGVMRIGGIVADYTRYVANGAPANDIKNTVITRANLDEFAGFLKASGWKAIWSVNFAQGTIPQAVDEAQAVSEALGSNLLALELGNEVEKNSMHGVPRLCRQFRARALLVPIPRNHWIGWSEWRRMRTAKSSSLPPITIAMGNDGAAHNSCLRPILVLRKRWCGCALLRSRAQSHGACARSIRFPVAAFQE